MVKNKPQKIEKIGITPCILSDHHGLKLEFNSNINFRNPTKWNLNNACLIYQWVKEEINEEIKDFLNSTKMTTQFAQIYVTK